ncbi:MAG: energy transducer TonB [Proteobacteria bacterium]|nr:energy transducer TonB [Pseudomonadota bacterium]NOG59563.1 energy transducer TonB [Pseudomonadota bacterium]
MKKQLNKTNCPLIKPLLFLLIASMPVITLAADDVLSMNKLLQQVKEGRAKDAADNKKREQAFIDEKAQQVARIQKAMNDVKALEEKSVALEQRFNTNELLVEEKRQQRNERLGSLKELFGHLTGAAGDMRSRFRNAITTSQFPEREAFLSGLIKKMNSDTDLPTLEEIERVWYELHQEMTESGRVVKYTTVVGTEKNREIIRIGLFNLVSQGEYLAYDADTRSLSVLPRQPVGLFLNAKALQNSPSDVTPVGIDPTGAAGGGFLKAIINTPTLEERWHQGRQVGYIITAVGAFAVLVALWRFLMLTLVSTKIRAQLKRKEIKTNNPLGRILKVADDNKTSDTESLELKMGEAILKESPKIQSGLSLLKIIAMVAPLLGLLGTVTGMIIVFQAITIYGAGDPKAMAGGISSALVTTVLGLCVAIPTLLLHTMLNGKARKLLHILEEQSAGIVAERSGQ